MKEIATNITDEKSENILARTEERGIKKIKCINEFVIASPDFSSGRGNLIDASNY